MKLRLLLLFLIFMFTLNANVIAETGKLTISAPNDVEAGKEFDIQISLDMDYGEYEGLAEFGFYLPFNKNFVIYVKHTQFYSLCFK